LIDRHRPRAGNRIGPLPCMNSLRTEAEVLFIDHGTISLVVHGSCDATAARDIVSRIHKRESPGGANCAVNPYLSVGMSMGRLFWCCVAAFDGRSVVGYDVFRDMGVTAGATSMRMPSTAAAIFLNPWGSISRARP
jgi:hypothetical protein